MTFFSRVFQGHTRGVYPLIFIPAEDEEVTQENFDWDGNKDILITGAADFTARSWSFETGKTLQVSAAPLLKKFRIKDSVYIVRIIGSPRGMH